MKRIMDRGPRPPSLVQRARVFHYSLNLCVLSLLLGGDFPLLMRLPISFFAPEP